MRVQSDGQIHTRILAWRLAAREPRPAMHRFEMDAWPSSDGIACAVCGKHFGLQGKFGPLSAVSHPCPLAASTATARQKR
eukprot:9648138-Alexandrium_andersonii.AAC.1